VVVIFSAEETTRVTGTTSPVFGACDEYNVIEALYVAGERPVGSSVTVSVAGEVHDVIDCPLTFNQLPPETVAVPGYPEPPAVATTKLTLDAESPCRTCLEILVGVGVIASASYTWNVMVTVEEPPPG
jgi:hypothetical protein